MFRSLLLFFFGLISLLWGKESKSQTSQAHHELGDVNPKGILAVGILLLMGGIGMQAGLSLLFFAMRDHRAATAFRTLTAPLPPEPRLQTNPEQDLKVYIQKEKQLLSSYDWIDPKAGKVRIPIKRAMELLHHKHRKVGRAQ